MLRPERTAPCASLSTTVSCEFSPVGNVLDGAVTVTDATGLEGGVATVTVASPVTPSAVAEIVTEPGATAVINPLAETVASAADALAQVTGRPVSTLPAASKSVAIA